MWYRINGELINLNRVVDIYIEGERELVFVLDIPVAGAGAGGGDTFCMDVKFSNAETVIKFKNASDRSKCFNKLTEVLGATVLEYK